ncbi:MAG: HesA/MoeB/ThiF family protein [Candidatus Margulisiibacteriota bacterium]|jgi:adenylyltransferase/sulfurtransferase
MNKDQKERYHRQLLLKDLGPAGQKKLFKAKVLVIGVGGLGSPCALYLAAAGVGTIGLADSDVVQLSNLQRQILHFTTDLNKPKVKSAKAKLSKLNPDVKIIALQTRVTDKNIPDIIKEFDFIIDATDNFVSKFLINDACVKAKKPFSHAGIWEWSGQTMTWLPGHTCYRCVFSQPPKKKIGKVNAVIGGAPGIIGSIQSLEAIKYILGEMPLLTDRLFTIDTRSMEPKVISLKRNQGCPACGEKTSRM